jgi:hypothetical protein
MNRSSLDRAVAGATGDSLHTVRRFGFQPDRVRLVVEVPRSADRRPSVSPSALRLRRGSDRLQQS